MDIDELWDKARKKTEVLRMRMQDPSASDTTQLPYIFLAESSLNAGDTVIRSGRVSLTRPSIILPNFSPQFEGFEFEEEFPINDEMLSTFLLVRGIHFPSLRYAHQDTKLDIFEGSLERAKQMTIDRLERAEDVQTGLVIGPEEAWQFSILLLVGALVSRSADGDLRRLLEQWRRKRNQS